MNKWRWAVAIAEMQSEKLLAELEKDNRLAPWFKVKVEIVLDNYRLAVEELLNELRN